MRQGPIAISVLFLLSGCDGKNNDITGTQCPEGTILCGELCTDPMTDDDFCGATDECEAGVSAGEICGTGYECVDGACELSCLGCIISDTCYGDGQVNPANPCQLCDVAADDDDWSDNDGATCEDGSFCTVADVCDAGSCAGTAFTCDDGIACNGTESCDEDTDTCEAGTPTCDPGEHCDGSTDTCVITCAGCIIGGICYADGHVDLLDTCQHCDVASATDDWSDNDGALCDDGLFCTIDDTCGSGICAGTTFTCDDGVACNGTESCDDTADECVPGTSLCSAGEFCDTSADSCVMTCGGGTTECGSSCVNTLTDPGNCGGCADDPMPGDNICATWTNATSVCVAATCDVYCDDGYGDCSGDASCETDLLASLTHCGMCGAPCATACLSGFCSIPYTFHNCGQAGRSGPIQTQCDAYYAGTTLEGDVTVTAGYQEWIVPATGTYRIEAYGASGAEASTYGRGAVMRGDFDLAAGETLWILVGQQGEGLYEAYNQIGGGGGTFVSTGSAHATSTLLLAAGGGGAAGVMMGSSCNGQIGTSGGHGYNDPSQDPDNNLGGTGGLAGGRGGEGFTWGDDYGMDAASGVNESGTSSQGFFDGGLGSQVIVGSGNGDGGFGGGGARISGSGYASCGGGGGYSGGGASDSTNGMPFYGGGGGSYNDGANQDNTSDGTLGHGKVVIFPL